MCNLSQGLRERVERRAQQHAEQYIAQYTEKYATQYAEKIVQANAIKVALGMLKKKMNLADIVEIAELPADKVREIAKANGLAVS